MVKLQMLNHAVPDNGSPPKIPPRMKRRGPALPEKPAHMRLHASHYPLNSESREILVAASKAAREKPVERRQREPAKLLLPTKKELSDRHVQPILLVPQTLLPWNSYAVWMPSRVRRDPLSSSAPHPKSGSVTRSGSLSSQDSDCGNETFPKSVLKKQRRVTPHESANREQKKNVTFNAFATVQLMPE